MGTGWCDRFTSGGWCTDSVKGCHECNTHTCSHSKPSICSDPYEKQDSRAALKGGGGGGIARLLPGGHRCYDQQQRGRQCRWPRHFGTQPSGQAAATCRSRRAQLGKLALQDLLLVDVLMLSQQGADAMAPGRSPALLPLLALDSGSRASTLKRFRDVIHARMRRAMRSGGWRRCSLAAPAPAPA